MTEVGQLAVRLACVVAAHAAVTSALGAATKREAMVRSGRSGLFVVCGLLTFASGILIYSLLSRDFQVEYVYSYSNRALPVFYTVSAFWAGQNGSLLLWAWLLAMFSSVALARSSRENAPLMPYVICLLTGITFFFLLLLVATADPFEKLPFVPADGLGLNPLLQNPQMVFHPPILYLGYVGFTIPFTYALASMWSGKLDEEWIVAVRRWSLFSWYFLGLGILLGAQWAYVELGWGGYWAWDPVENASLMPWLTGTAFLHSVMVEERRRMLRAWNMVLIVMTFALTIFGTFITRSGVISSVHAFGQSAIGYYFLVFLGVILAWSIVLLRGRWRELRLGQEVESLVSREGSVMLGNVLLVGAACAIFWGTIFPVLSEVLRGVKVAVGPLFYNRVSVPIGLGILLLIGLCPQLVWRRASSERLARSLVSPVLAALCGVVVLAAADIRHPWAFAAYALAVFALVATGRELFRVRRSRRVAGEERPGGMARDRSVSRQRRCGGYLVHVGMILIFVAIAGSSAYKTEVRATLHRGESTTIGRYTVRYEGVTVRQEADKEVHSAALALYNEGRPAGMLRPERNFYYSHPSEPASEVAIRSTLREDVYTVLGDYAENGEVATLLLVVNPLVMWLWIGGLVVTMGWIAVMSAEQRAGGSRGRHAGVPTP